MTVHPEGQPAVTNDRDGHKVQHARGKRQKELPAAERLRARVQTTVIYNWDKHGTILTVDAICAWHKIPGQEAAVAAALNDPVTIANLIRAGVYPDDGDLDPDRPAPTALQVKAVHAFLDSVDPDQPKTLFPALAEVGVGKRQWNGWLRDRVFVSYLKDVAGRLFGDHRYALDAALLKTALSGDPAALKLVYQVTGRLDGHHEDPAVLVARVLEVLARHLDPGTMTAVARDLAAVTSGPGVLPKAEIIDQSGAALSPVTLVKETV